VHFPESTLTGPQKLSDRAKRDMAVQIDIGRAFAENFACWTG